MISPSRQRVKINNNLTFITFIIDSQRNGLETQVKSLMLLMLHP